MGTSLQGLLQPCLTAPGGCRVSWPCPCLGRFFLSSGSSSCCFSSSDRVPDSAQRSLCIGLFVISPNKLRGGGCKQYLVTRRKNDGPGG